MFNKKEIASIAVASLIIGFSFNFLRRVEVLHWTILSVFIVIMANILAKKIAAYYLESEVETKIWDIRRYGLIAATSGGYVHPSKEFKKPFQIGAFLPLVFAVMTYGYIVWMASLVFDVKAKIYRAARRHGLYTYSEMTEYHLGLIAAAGIVANLAFSILGYLIGFDEFARIGIFYAFFNTIPISDLDGNKIFFGSIILWSFLASIVLVGMGYVFLVV